MSVVAMSFFSGEPLFQWLLVAAMLLTGLYNALWKEPVAVLGGKRLIFYRSVFVLFLVLPWALIQGFSASIAEFSLFSPGFQGLILIALLSYPGLYFFVRATKSGPTSLVVPVAWSMAIMIPLLIDVTPVFPFVIFSVVKFQPASYPGLVMLFTGLLLLKFRVTSGKLVFFADAGFRDALISALLTGIVLAVSKVTISSTGSAVIILTEEGSILVFSLLHILFSRYLGKLRRKSNKSVSIRWTKDQLQQHWKNYIWIIGTIGIMSGLAVVFRIISTRAPQYMATFILSFSVLVTVIAAQLYYSEKLRVQQKIAVFLLIAGILLISWVEDGQLQNLQMLLE